MFYIQNSMNYEHVVMKQRQHFVLVLSNILKVFMNDNPKSFKNGCIWVSPSQIKKINKHVNASKWSLRSIWRFEGNSEYYYKCTKLQINEIII